MQHSCYIQPCEGEKIQHCLLIYMHTCPCCPVMCEKAGAIKHRPTPWRMWFRACVCVCVSRVICSSNSAMFSGDHSSPLHAFWCYHGYLRSAEVIFSICELSPQADMFSARRPLSQDGSDREEWGILWLIISVLSQLKRIMSLEEQRRSGI